MEMTLESVVCTCILDLSVATSVCSMTSSTSAERTQVHLPWSKVFAPLIESGESPLCFLFSFHLSTGKMSGSVPSPPSIVFQEKKIGGVYSEVGLLRHVATLFLIFEQQPHYSLQ